LDGIDPIDGIDGIDLRTRLTRLTSLAIDANNVNDVNDVKRRRQQCQRGQFCPPSMQSTLSTPSMPSKNAAAVRRRGKQRQSNVRLRRTRGVWNTLTLLGFCHTVTLLTIKSAPIGRFILERSLVRS
jgi:hypothetical protein